MSDENQGDQSPELTYHVVVVPDVGDVVVESFAEVDQLTDRLTELSSESVTVSIFEGRRLLMTKGPQRYLQIDDEYLPLFDEADPNELELDEGGYMGELAPPMIGTGYTSTEEIEETEPPDEG
jgi:hypothetical protein